MRLWSLHPKYLDRRGLVALWREGLLAQAVLRGLTRGYTRHPQLVRFQESGAPVRTIASYLQAVHAEATRRGYTFDRTRLARSSGADRLTVSRGQLQFEWNHLVTKLRARDRQWLRGLQFSGATPLRAHPSFRIVPGGVETWERGHVSAR